MLSFLMPLWLWGVPVVAAVGVWALWKGRHSVHRVSSSKLWAGLSGNASGRKVRLVDPVWLMVLLAAILAAFLLAGPMWTPRGDAEGAGARVTWSIRSLTRAGPAQLFVEIEEPRGVGETCMLAINGSPQTVPTRELLAGHVVDVTAGTQAEVQLNSGDDLLARAEFTLPAGQDFALLTHRSADGALDAALWRAFSIHPGARVNLPMVRPAVLLVDDPRFSAGQAEEKDTLLIASPRTSLPGITLGETVTLNPPGQPDSQAIALSAVRVERYRKAVLSPEWQVLATINGDPWVALRVDRAEPSRRWLWLASWPATETNWGVDVSFVVLLLRQLDAVTAPVVETAGSASTLDWVEKREANRKVAQTSAGIPLSPFVGAMAMLFLAGASGLLVWRSRAIRR